MEIKNIKEIRTLKLMTSKSGTGYDTFRTSIPKKWVDEMGLSKENRDIKVSFDGEKIIIEKAED